MDDQFSETDTRAKAKQDGITHISTGVAALRAGRILVVRRTADDYLGGVYELPGGGVDKNESITEGAIRELKEETGLTVSRILTTFDGFDYSTDRKPHVRQINFLVEVVPGEIVLHPKEHDTFQWIDEDGADSLFMTDDMRACVKAALQTARQAQ